MEPELTFDKLPEAVREVNLRLKRIESILCEKTLARPVETDKKMSIQETADFLNCAVPTIYGLVHRRKIPHEKKGKRLYFLKSEIVEWMRKGKRLTVDEIRSQI